MINYIDKESEKVQKSIYLAPVFMTLHAANADGVLVEKEIEAAEDFVRIETYNGPEFLMEYFKKVEKTFTEELKDWNLKLPLGKEYRDDKLVSLMAPTREFMKKLDEEEVAIFKRELLEFTSLVDKSNRSIFEASILPLFSGFLHKKNEIDSDDILG